MNNVEKALEIDCSSAEATFEKAKILELNNQEMKAWRMLKKTILIQPNYIDALYYFGQVTYKRKMFNSTVILLEKITKIDPKLRYFYSYLILSLKYLGREEK